MAASDQGDRLTLEGLVIPANWDQQGRVTGVVIAAFDETQYRVLNEGQGQQLLALVHRWVRVRGRAVKEPGKGISILVQEVEMKRNRAAKFVGNSLIVTMVGLALAIALPGLSLSAEKKEPTKAEMKAKTEMKAKAGMKAKAKAKAKAKVRISPRVMAVQKKLMVAGYKIKADGIYGPKTRASLKKYQKKNGLKANGRINKATLAKMGLK